MQVGIHLPHLIHWSVTALKSKGASMSVIISGLFLPFGNLSKYQIPHGITTRSGGKSVGKYSSFNLAKYVGDDHLAVENNRKTLQNAIKKDRLVFANQIHSNHIVAITANNYDRIFNADGLITNQPNIAIGVMVADCVPILLFDPIHNAVGAVHAGWRGTAKEIAARAVEKMGQNYRSKPSDLIVGIGPAIKSCCYAIENPAPFKQLKLDSALTQISNIKWRLDLQQANRIQLERIGVKNIEIMEHCTSCDKRFYSYRRDKTTGRFVGIIGLRPFGASL